MNKARDIGSVDEGEVENPVHLEDVDVERGNVPKESQEGEEDSTSLRQFAVKAIAQIADDERESIYVPADNKKLYKGLPPHLTAIKVTCSIDALLVKDIIQPKAILLILIEILKVCVFIGCTEVAINSCAVFSPTVLLLGGSIIYAQIAAIGARKLYRALLILTYEIDADEPLFVMLRAAGILGLALVELFFIIATYWYLDTLTDVVNAVTSGLTLLVVSNLDSFALQYLGFETVVFKVKKNYFSQELLDFVQVSLAIIMFAILFIIALAISYSDHSDYKNEYCD